MDGTDAAEALMPALVGKLVGASQCRTSSSLPPGTEAAALQVGEIVLAATKIPDVEARCEHLAKVLGFLQPFIEADVTTRTANSDAATLGEAMALACLPCFAIAAIDMTPGTGVNTNTAVQWWFGAHSAAYSAACVQQLLSSGRLQQLVKLLEDPSTEPRDRTGACEYIAAMTFSFFSSGGKNDGIASRADLLQQVLEGSGLVRAFGAVMLAVVPPSCAAADDPRLQFNGFVNNLHGWLSNVLQISKGDGRPELYEDFCKLCIDSGCGVALCSYLEMFERSDPSKDGEVIPWLAIVCSDIQLLASSGQRAARRILSECCTSPKALHTSLMACVQRGCNCPFAFQFVSFTVHARAGMCISVLFGREEDEEGANTVPPDVTVQIVRSMKSIVDGGSSSSPVNLADVLGCLSLSDANTVAMVSPPDGGIGILDVFTMMFLQGDDIVGSWEAKSYRYNVGLARESCAVVLLNLALSARTAAAVANHAELLSAIDQALNDADNLTRRARKLLNDIVFQAKMVSGQQQDVTARRAAAASRIEKHVMLSYAWAQQETVLRIRTALGRLGHSVWIDVEQMSGSTVDSMATAIDSAQVVLYCISENYKVSQNCRMEAMYGHQIGVKMVPLMLEQGSGNAAPGYRANGWLGMLLGTRLWYGFFGAVLEDSTRFDAKMAELCRELKAPPRASPPVAAAAVPAAAAAAATGSSIMIPGPAHHGQQVAAAALTSPSLAAGTPVQEADSDHRHHHDGFTPRRLGLQQQEAAQGSERYANGNDLDNSQVVARLGASSQSRLSEGFLLNVQVERERVSAERAERAERAAAAERIALREHASERERAAERAAERVAERELRLLIAAAMVVCASAVACAVLMKPKP